MRPPYLRAATGIAVGIICACVARPAAAQKERPGGILRNLIQTIAPGSPEDLENRARSTREVTTALNLYGTLESRFGNRPEGVRASIWLGLYAYGRDDPESALLHFEQARKNARGPILSARATFWCEQTRLITGREPVTDDLDRAGGGFWGTLRGLARVDRSIRAERRSDAEQELLSLEGDARRAGLLGPQIARWGDLLRLPGPGGRIDPGALGPLLRATAELPERLQVRLRTTSRVDSGSPLDAKWAIQFGAFLDQDHATALVRVLESRGVKTRVDGGDEGGRRWYRVRLDESLDRGAADSLVPRIQVEAGIPCQIVPVR